MPDPSDLTTLLSFVNLVKQEEGMTAHQADLYTIAASLVGLMASIRDRFAEGQPLDHLALTLGLSDVVQWISERIMETRDNEQP